MVSHVFAAARAALLRPGRHLPTTAVLFTVLAALSTEDPLRWVTTAHGQQLGASARVEEIVEQTNVRGGVVIHVGCGDGELVAAFGQLGSQYLVHGLERDPAAVRAARVTVRKALPYGSVSVDRLMGQTLPYVENLANLVIVEAGQEIPAAEIMRVLAPRGVAYVRQGGQWQKTVKPRPQDIDDWTHYLHDASGNAVAHDEKVGPPRHLQWLGSPRWSRHHDRMASMTALVSAGGRMFYIMDEGSRVSIQLPPKWTLVARDAFNGTILWKRPLADWHSHLWPLKSGPTQLARRLVATDDRVFVTLGLRAPLVALDAATGKTVHTYHDSASTEEILNVEQTVYALVNKGESELTSFAPKLNLGDQRRVGEEFQWNELPREVVAYDVAGKEKWRMESRVVPLTLSADTQRVYFHNGSQLVCLDQQGKQLWKSEPVARKARIPMNFGPKLVLYKDVVLFAGGDRKMQAFDSASGKPLWSAPHAQSGYQSPEDLLVAGGLVWNAPTTRTQDSGVFKGRDPRTGEVKSEFEPNVSTYWFHHRCYIAKATDRFLMPSRTGIEFVDTEKQDWDIHHWVRGGCLYGVMPCNGLLYAPPHNCACYPEAKLYGLNALAPATASRQIDTRNVSDEERLERGEAYDEPLSATATAAGQWPTYRHDAARSGAADTPLATELNIAWETELGGRLSAPTVAQGRIFVAAIDAHTVHALDARNGKPLWQYTAGGRVDSPPTISAGRVVFGSADGWVYCLRESDGALIWRFRAAPRDQRLAAFEQLESVWPVHGSVLVKEGEVYFVAGRSNFLDGGLRFLRLELASGRKLDEEVIDERDPESGRNLQERLQVLQMPVGLPDILSSDGNAIYMRSQQFDTHGKRINLGPNSGDFALQGGVQRGPTAHLFAPMGFLDDTWFHRSYWVYGRSFAGGHAGYYQAGKYAPSGRILVFDQKRVYGFGRKPEYLRWTTVLEHQLFAAPKEAPEVELRPRNAARNRRGTAPMIHVTKAASINPANKPLTIEAWVKTERLNGVVAARGGPAIGYALVFSGGRPQFVYRASGDEVVTISGKQRIVNRWVHLAGQVTADKQLHLFVDGKQVASGKVSQLIGSDPQQSLEIGGDEGGAVGDYGSPAALRGWVEDVRIYHQALSPDQIMARFQTPTQSLDVPAALVYTFEGSDARDGSGNANHGKLDGIKPEPGKFGTAMRFPGGAGGGQPGSPQADSFVQFEWTQDLPLLARALVLAQDNLFVAGPPDLIDERETFERLAERDPRVQEKLAEQDRALDGAQGGLLWVVSAANGTRHASVKLPSLPVWDGMCAADSRLFVVCEDGKVRCLDNPADR